MEDNAQYGFMAVYWFLSKPLYRESSWDAVGQHIEETAYTMGFLWR